MGGGEKEADLVATGMEKGRSAASPIIQKNAGSTSLLVMYTSSDSVSASSQIVTGSIKV